MNGRRAACHCLAAVAVLASLGAGADKKPAPELPPEAVKAWRDAGATAGWMTDVPPRPALGYGYWEPFRETAESGAAPAFKFHPDKDGVFAGLPDPGVPFGLDLHCCAGTDEQLRGLAGLKSLHSLNLGGAALLTDAGLKELAKLKNLRGLYLFYSRVTDAGLKELASLKDLQVLDLTHTQVTDAGLKELARLKELRALNLTDAQVTDAGLKELAGLKDLQWLALRGTKVTPAGVAAIQKQLPKCRVTTGDD